MLELALKLATKIVCLKHTLRVQVLALRRPRLLWLAHFARHRRYSRKMLPAAMVRRHPRDPNLFQGREKKTIGV